MTIADLVCIAGWFSPITTV